MSGKPARQHVEKGLEACCGRLVSSQINASTILWRDRTVQIDVFADELGGHFGPRADRRPARPQPVHAAKARFIGEHDAQVSSAPGGSPAGFPSTASGKPFFACILRGEVALGMKRTRHQLAPKPCRCSSYRPCWLQRSLCPIAFVGRLEITWMFSISPAPAALAKARQQSLLLGQRHVLVFATAIRPRPRRLDAAVVTGMCARFTVLSDAPIAAAIAGCVIPLSRNSTIWMRWRCAAVSSIAAQFFSRRIRLAAFDHLLSPNQMAQLNHTSAEENNSPSSLRRSPTKKLFRFKPFLEVV